MIFAQRVMGLVTAMTAWLSPLGGVRIDGSYEEHLEKGIIETAFISTGITFQACKEPRHLWEILLKISLSWHCW